MRSQRLLLAAGSLGEFRQIAQASLTTIQRIYAWVVDIHFLYQGQSFVWDSEKASINLRKHGVSFEIACQIVFDRFIHLEDASVDDEQRDAAIGMTEGWMLLLVVHIQRKGGTNRII